MTPLEVFQNPGLAELSEGATASVMLSLNGLPVPVGMSALFSVFLALAIKNGMDAGVEFERLLATFEQRTQLMHRGSAALN